MEKVVFLLWGPWTRWRATGCATSCSATVAPRCWARRRALTVNVHDTAAAEAPSPAPAARRASRRRSPQVSVWLDSYDKRAGVDDALAAPGLAVSGHLVTESVYDDYGTTPHAAPRDWPDGERSPGVLTVALVHRPADLALRRVDRALARHAVARVGPSCSPAPATCATRCTAPSPPDAPEIDGIVEEGWPSAAHVADPMLFFNAGRRPRAAAGQHRADDGQRHRLPRPRPACAA